MISSSERLNIATSRSVRATAPYVRSCSSATVSGSLLTSASFILPVVFAQWWHQRLLQRGREAALESVLARLHPISLAALLATIGLLFAFQGD